MISYKQPEKIDVRQAIQWIAHGIPPCARGAEKNLDIPEFLLSNIEDKDTCYLLGNLAINKDSLLNEKKAQTYLYIFIDSNSQDLEITMRPVYKDTSYPLGQQLTIAMHEVLLNSPSDAVLDDIESMDWVNGTIDSLMFNLSLNEKKFIEVGLDHTHHLKLYFNWLDIKDIKPLNIASKSYFKLLDNDLEFKPIGRPSIKDELSSALYALFAEGFVNYDNYMSKFVENEIFLNTLKNAPLEYDFVFRGRHITIHKKIADLLKKFESDK
jgi:hypothetical protein